MIFYFAWVFTSGIVHYLNLSAEKPRFYFLCRRTCCMFMKLVYHSKHNNMNCITIVSFRSLFTNKNISLNRLQNANIISFSHVYKILYCMLVILEEILFCMMLFLSLDCALFEFKCRECMTFSFHLLILSKINLYIIQITIVLAVSQQYPSLWNEIPRRTNRSILLHFYCL